MFRYAYLFALLFLACGPDDDGDDITDDDGDGYAAEDDCDDADPAVHPDASERCNELDDDCDDEVDEGLDIAFYADADNDGFGDAAVESTGCTQPEGTVVNADDCDDSVVTTNPDAADLCDGIDNDCDGSTDEGVTETLYTDADGDGYGDAALPVEACASSDGYAATGDDCDDTNADIHPDADETNCADLTDFNCDGVSNFTDADSDGWATCVDCDDEDPAFSPDAPETCNDLDDDCDDEIDEDVEVGNTYYTDADGDGYGDPDGATTTACDAPEGYADNAEDCDDTHPFVNPSIPEICDAFDDDCDGLTDEVC